MFVGPLAFLILLFLVHLATSVQLTLGSLTTTVPSSRFPSLPSPTGTSSSSFTSSSSNTQSHVDIPPTPTADLFAPPLDRRYDIWREALSTDYHQQACSAIALSTGTLVIDRATVIDLDRTRVLVVSSDGAITETRTFTAPDFAAAVTAAAIGAASTTTTTFQRAAPPPPRDAAPTAASTQQQQRLQRRQQHTLSYTPFCVDGHPVQIQRPSTHRAIPNLVAAFETDWHAYLLTTEGKFSLSAIPYIYSIGISTAVCVLLTLLVLCFQWDKRPFLFKFSLVLASAYLLAITGVSMSELQKQHRNGYQSVSSLRRSLRSPVIYGLNLAFNTILYLAEVQTTMLLFSRQKEKRIVFWIGGSLTVVAQTIWGISVFHQDVLNSALPAFAYLFQIALAILFLCCTCYYAITHYHSVLDPDLLPITMFAMVAAASTLTLFIVDLADVWVIEWSDAVAWVATAVAIITVWEWFERSDKLERHRERNGILGRQIFEDEALFGPDDYAEDCDSDDESDDSDDDDDEKGTGKKCKKLVVRFLPSHKAEKRRLIVRRSRKGSTQSSESSQSKQTAQSGSSGSATLSSLRQGAVSSSQGRNSDINITNNGDIITATISHDSMHNSIVMTDAGLVSVNRTQHQTGAGAHDNDDSDTESHLDTPKPWRSRYYRFAVDPFVYLSDFLINLGLAFSRPMSVVSDGSANNMQPLTTTDTTAPKPVPPPHPSGALGGPRENIPERRMHDPAQLRSNNHSAPSSSPVTQSRHDAPAISTPSPLLAPTQGPRDSTNTLDNGESPRRDSPVLYHHHYTNNRLHFYSRNLPNTTFSKRWNASDGSSQDVGAMSSSSSALQHGDAGSPNTSGRSSPAFGHRVRSLTNPLVRPQNLGRLAARNNCNNNNMGLGPLHHLEQQQHQAVAQRGGGTDSGAAAEEQEEEQQAPLVRFVHARKTGSKARRSRAPEDDDARNQPPPMAPDAQVGPNSQL